MKIFSFVLFVILSVNASAQYYNSYFQLDGAGGYSPNIYTSTELPNGNLSYNMSLYDSTRLTPTNISIFNPMAAVKPSTALVCLKPDQTVAWSHTWSPINNNSTTRITSYKTLSDAQGNIYLSGFYQGDIDLDPTPGTHLCTPLQPNNLNAFIVKFDLNGNYLWSRNFESSNAQYASSIITDANLHSNGNIYFVGRFTGSVNFGTNTTTPQVFNSPFNIDKPFILSLDTNGNFVQLLTNTVGNITNTSFSINSFKINNLGETFITYHISDSIDIDFSSSNSVYYSHPTINILAKYDPNFQLVWSRALDPNIISMSIDTIDNSNFFLFGEYRNTATFGNNTTATAIGLEDIYYEKWDGLGNCTWSKTIGGTQSNFISGIKKLNGNLYLLHSYIGTLFTNTGLNDTSLSSPSTNAVVSRLDLMANHIESKEISSPGGVFVKKNGFDTHNDLLNLNITIQQQTDIDPSASVLNLTKQWNTVNAACIVKWGLNAPLILNKELEQDAITVYPNPNNGHFNIKLDDKSVIEVYTLQGQIIYTFEGKKGTNKIYLSPVSSGTYFIRNYNKNKTSTAIITIKE